jgi:hypothetical protein
MFTGFAVRMIAWLVAGLLYRQLAAPRAGRPAASAALRGNALAAFAAPTLQHKPTALGGHPLAEAMAAGALEVARLKCPFHGSLLWVTPSATA